MAYEIRVVEGERPEIERTLNESAIEGWQLVSCWPEGKKVVGVFQRPAAQASDQGSLKSASERAKPAPLPSAPASPAITLEDVLAACLAVPLTKNKKGESFRGGLSVAQFAKQHGVTKESMLSDLQNLGLKAKKDENDKKYRKFVKGHSSLWLRQAGQHGAWYVDMADPKSSTK